MPTTPTSIRQAERRRTSTVKNRNYSDIYRRAAAQMDDPSVPGRPAPYVSNTPQNIGYLNSYVRPGMAPDTGMTADQYAQAILTGGNRAGSRDTSGGSGRSGRSGGGGFGGGGAGVNPAVASAYQALLAAYTGQPVGKRFDDLSAQVQGLGATGGANVRGILAEMDARAQQARAATNQAYQQGDQRLQGLQSTYGGVNDSRQGALNSILASFGAGAVQSPGSDLQALIGAGRTANSMGQTGYDTMFADRGAISAGLGADVLTQQQSQMQALAAQIAAQKAAAEMQREQEIMQLRLQAAQAGVTI